jgi:predicted TIM-barrel fold metal-dependent hydrolase
MAELPPEMQARREFEDQALQLGAERAKLENQLGSNLEQIVALLDKAPGVGVSIDHYARMIGVRRQQLYRWRDSIALLRRNTEEES